jgi:hypothetical protein
MLHVQPLYLRLPYPRSMLGVITTSWFKLVQSIRDPYRPERHYMRGRGPRWNAKHQSQAGSAVI